MTEDEKKQYELARLGIARLMGDASEVEKWGEKVSQTRAAELQRAAVAPEQICPSCKGTGADPMSDVTNWLPCQKCAGKSTRSGRS